MFETVSSDTARPSKRVDPGKGDAFDFTGVLDSARPPESLGEVSGVASHRPHDDATNVSGVPDAIALPEEGGVPPNSPRTWLSHTEKKQRSEQPRWSGTRRRRKFQGPAPKGMDRLVTERLVQRKSDMAAVVEAILCRAENPRSADSLVAHLIDFLRFCRRRDQDPFGRSAGFFGAGEISPIDAPAPTRGEILEQGNRTRDLVGAWLASTRDRWAPLTRRRAITSVRSIYLEGSERGVYLGPDPTKRLPRISSEPRNDPPALTLDEVADLLSLMDDKVKSSPDRGDRLRALRNRLAVHVFLYTGLRLSELTGLRWSDRQRYGNYRVLSIIGKGDKPAKVKTTPALESLFDEFRGAVVASGITLRSDDPVFLGFMLLNGTWPPHVRVRKEGEAVGMRRKPDSRGRGSASASSGATGAMGTAGMRMVPQSNHEVYRMVDEALAAVGRDEARTGPHLLRRTSGTLVYEATRDLYQVQRHLRHASPATTSQHYIRQADPFRDAGIDHLDFGRRENAR